MVVDMRCASFNASSFRVRTQDGVQGLDAVKVGTDGHIFHGATMLPGMFGRVPRTGILYPTDVGLRGDKVDVHVGPVQFMDRFIHRVFFL